VKTLARWSEDRLVDGVVDVGRHDLADDALAVLPDEQRVAQEGIALQDFRRLVDLVDLGDAHALVAVVENIREKPLSGNPIVATAPADFCVNCPM
jgi:hypothetical protein